MKTLLNRVRRGTGAAKPTAHDPRTVGLRDSQLGGWNLAQIGQLADGFTIKAEDTVIDVGCGEGGTANFAAYQGAEVIATDIDEVKVEQTRQKLQKSKARCFETMVSDSNPLPIADERVTKVICMEVMEHVPDPQQFISELVRVGKPGAQYLLTVPDPASENLQKDLAPPCYWEAPNHLRIFSHEEFETLVDSAGLIIEKKILRGFYWSMWWVFFWASNQQLGEPEGPILKNWTETWNAVLQSEKATQLKQVLDHHLPKSQIIIARKPA